ncbi:MAG: nucleotidyl transferase AbiEii/AbiGii toxin family protein [Syntrophobacteraceae bacterium]
MFEDLLVSIAQALKKNGLPYMIIGGQAVLLYGTPRMTKDIDITLGVDVENLDKTVEIVRRVGLEIIPESFEAFVKETFVLPTKDRSSGIRVDFIFSFIPYGRQAIDRANPVFLQDTAVMFASVEDVMIHKVFAGRPRDIEDVRSIILKNPDFDREYTRKWLREFDRSIESGGFTRQLEDLLKEADLL